MTDDLDQAGPPDRCTAVINNVFLGLYAWHVIGKLPPHTHQCDDDAEDGSRSTFDKGQTRLCAKHTRMREEEDLAAHEAEGTL